MKAYAQFFITFNNNVQELLGTDGILPLDNRFNLTNQIITVKNYINILNNNLNKGICKFEIRKCSESFPFDNYHVVHSEDVRTEN